MDKPRHVLNLSVVKSVGKNAIRAPAFANVYS